MKINHVAALALLTTGCTVQVINPTAPVQVVASASPSPLASEAPTPAPTPQVYDGGEFSLDLPAGWKVEPNPVQNIPTLLVSATQDSPRVVVSVNKEFAVPAGGFLSKEAAEEYLRNFSNAMVASSNGTDLTFGSPLAGGMVGKSVGYFATFGYHRPSAETKNLSVEFAITYRGGYVYVITAVSGVGNYDREKFKAITDTFRFE